MPLTRAERQNNPIRTQGRCRPTTSHGVFLRSTEAKSALSQSICWFGLPNGPFMFPLTFSIGPGLPAPRSVSVSSETKWTGPTSYEYHMFETPPDSADGIAKWWLYQVKSTLGSTRQPSRPARMWQFTSRIAEEKALTLLGGQAVIGRVGLVVLLVLHSAVVALRALMSVRKHLCERL